MRSTALIFVALGCGLVASLGVYQYLKAASKQDETRCRPGGDQGNQHQRAAEPGERADRAVAQSARSRKARWLN